MEDRVGLFPEVPQVEQWLTFGAELNSLCKQACEENSFRHEECTPNL